MDAAAAPELKAVSPLSPDTVTGSWDGLGWRDLKPHPEPQSFPDPSFRAMDRHQGIPCPCLLLLLRFCQPQPRSRAQEEHPRLPTQILMPAQVTRRPRAANCVDTSSGRHESAPQLLGEALDNEEHPTGQLFLKEFVTIHKLLGDLSLPALKLRTK